MKPSLVICRSIVLGGCISLSVAACSVLPEAKPVQSYVLTPVDMDTGSATPGIDQALRISRPQSNPALDNTRIAVLPDGPQLSSYQGARWASPAPTLLHDYLLEFFRGDDRFAALSSDNQYVLADLELNSTLLAFQTEYINDQPQVVVRMDAQLIDISKQRIIASKRFVIHQKPESPRIQFVIQAFDEATARLAQQLADWVTHESAAK